MDGGWLISNVVESLGQSVHDGIDIDTYRPNDSEYKFRIVDNLRTCCPDAPTVRIQRFFYHRSAIIRGRPNSGGVT